MRNELQYYGLKFPPFSQEIHDLGVRFESEDLKKSVGMIRHVSALGGLGILCGDSGTGASFGAYCALQEMQKRAESVRCMTVFQSGERDFYKEACRVLGIQPAGKTRQVLISSIREKADQMTQQGHPILLVLDNAQNLLDEVLDVLPCFTYDTLGTRAVMTIVLCGTKELKYRVSLSKNEALRQCISGYHILNGLTKDEVGKYVLHRLKCAGGSPNLVSEEALDMLYDLSQKGNCRELNNIMRDALVIGMSAKRTIVDPEVLRASAQHRF